MMFVFAVTFFVACFTLDQRRLESNRNGALPCIEHQNYRKSQCSQQQWSNKFFKIFYSKVIFSNPGKVDYLLLGTSFLIPYICFVVSSYPHNCGLHNSQHGKRFKVETGVRSHLVHTENNIFVEILGTETEILPRSRI